MATMSSAAMTTVHSVRPEMGLFDEPIIPTRLPETAAKKNPRTIMTTAATAAGPGGAAEMGFLRGPDHTGQVAEDRREEESENDREDGRHCRRSDGARKVE